VRILIELCDGQCGRLRALVRGEGVLIFNVLLPLWRRALLRRGGHYNAAVATTQSTGQMPSRVGSNSLMSSWRGRPMSHNVTRRHRL